MLLAYRNSLSSDTMIAFWKPQASVRAVLDRNQYPAYHREYIYIYICLFMIFMLLLVNIYIYICSSLQHARPPRTSETRCPAR